VEDIAPIGEIDIGVPALEEKRPIASNHVAVNPHRCRRIVRSFSGRISSGVKPTRWITRQKRLPLPAK
jgi:hypothetical protein